MLDIDFDAHNREVKEVWDAFNARTPVRVPVVVGVNPRYYIFTPWLNPRKITFQEYTENVDLMMETQLEFQHYMRHNMLQDAEMGMPKEAWPMLYVDLQNYYEAAWFGCQVRYHEGQVPDAVPILTDDRTRMLFDKGIPDPFTDGIMKRNVEYYEYMSNKIKDFTFMGLPVAAVMPAGVGTDGPFTVACNIRGATEVCMDIYENPDYVHELLTYITDATIARVKAWRDKLGWDQRPVNWGFADDSILLLSTEMYREFVLPHHKRLVSELAGEGPHSIHLCGDATRHFKTIRDELNVWGFDTGFPVDFAWLRRELGPDVAIYGGPTVQLLQQGTPEAVREASRAILESGIMEGGRFVLREANNLSPGTPEANMAAMYQAAKDFGRYD